jgi:hypothetical protein
MKKPLAGGARHLYGTIIALAFIVFPGCNAKPVQDEIEPTPPVDTQETVIRDDLTDSYFKETIEGEDGNIKVRYVKKIDLGIPERNFYLVNSKVISSEKNINEVYAFDGDNRYITSCFLGNDTIINIDGYESNGFNSIIIPGKRIQSGYRAYDGIEPNIFVADYYDRQPFDHIYEIVLLSYEKSDMRIKLFEYNTEAEQFVLLLDTDIYASGDDRYLKLPFDASLYTLASGSGVLIKKRADTVQKDNLRRDVDYTLHVYEYEPAARQFVETYILNPELDIFPYYNGDSGRSKSHTLSYLKFCIGKEAPLFYYSEPKEDSFYQSVNYGYGEENKVISAVYGEHAYQRGLQYQEYNEYYNELEQLKYYGGYESDEYKRTEGLNFEIEFEGLWKDGDLLFGIQDSFNHYGDDGSMPGHNTILISYSLAIPQTESSETSAVLPEK